MIFSVTPVSSRYFLNSPRRASCWKIGWNSNQIQMRIPTLNSDFIPQILFPTHSSAIYVHAGNLFESKWFTTTKLLLSPSERLSMKITSPWWLRNLWVDSACRSGISVKRKKKEFWLHVTLSIPVCATGQSINESIESLNGFVFDDDTATLCGDKQALFSTDNIWD